MIFNTSVAFLIFKRPKETFLVFEQIRKARPSKLFIVADGPRNSDEKELTDETRKIVSNVDWPCEVFRNYSDTNLGCKKRVSSGLDWVFENVDKAIILEDDCVPSNSFFVFCQEMLEKYNDRDDIMHIGGLNMQINRNDLNSYYFSRIAQIWGWATWRRAWKKYDVNMTDWPEIKTNKIIDNILKDNHKIDYFNYLYERMYKGELSTWDVAWTYTCMKENAYAIVPNKNLIKNIGLGNNATHTNGVKGNFGEFVLEEIDFPLIHPANFSVNTRADNFIYKKVFGINSRLSQKILIALKFNFPFIYNFLKKIYRKK